MSPFVTRFAPSPTGYLHLGHALSALTAFEAAREARGRFLLRIEDIDQTRCRAEYEAAIHEDLAWLGLDWEQPVRRQSDFLADYHRALGELYSRGLVYPSRRSRRAEVEAAADRRLWSGVRFEEVGAALGEPFAWRLSLAAARESLAAAYERLGFVERIGGAELWQPADPAPFGDVVLGRKDAPASYHLAVVWDDAAQGVSEVIRGEDLRAATHLHCLLQALLGLPTPVYRFHRLIPDPETGRKFSKRDGAKSLRSLREEGLRPADIGALIAPYRV